MHKQAHTKLTKYNQQQLTLHYMTEMSISQQYTAQNTQYQQKKSTNTLRDKTKFIALGDLNAKHKYWL